MVKRWSPAFVFVAAVAAFFLHPVPTSAQTRTTGWTPWLGCWQAEGAPAGEYLCVVPEGTGVRMLTVADGAVRADARVMTDGRAREIEQDGCTGSERASWSNDGQRVFLGSSLTCDGGLTRRATGIFAFAGPTEWLSVQTVTIDDRVASRAVRYRSVQPTDLPPEVAGQVRGVSTAAFTARQSIIAAIDEADVNEAASNVDPTAVQEWLDATRQPFQIGDGVESAVVSASALDLTAGSNFETLHASPSNVRIVERIVEKPVPVYVHDHVHVVRRCWDPFVAGYVDVFGGWGWGVTYGSAGCHRAYYSRYSPWGYDLYGWRVVHRPIVIVRGAPIIVRVRDRDYWRNRDYWRDRDWNRDRGSARDRNWGDGRITRDGYRSDRPSERTPGRVVRSVTDTNTPRVARPSDRTAEPRVARPSDRSAEPRVARPSDRTAEPRVARPSGRSAEPRVARPSDRSAEPRVARPSDRSTEPRVARPSDRSAEPRVTRPSDRSAEPRAARPAPSNSRPDRAGSSRNEGSKDRPTTRSARTRADS